jgi:tetratricopeptide (TPR) repeat protein
VWHYEWRWRDAETEFRRAIELNPSYSLVRIWYANLLMSRLRMKEALEQVYAARELDPFSLIVNTNVGWVLNNAGRHDDAIAHLRQTLALDSEYVQARWRLAAALTAAGRYVEALEEGRRLVTLSDSSLPALALYANINAHAGNRDTARARLGDVLARGRHEYVPAGSIAGVFAALGDTANTFAWLEKAFAEGSNLIAYLGSDPDYVALRPDPRFQALLSRAGLK